MRGAPGPRPPLKTVVKGRCEQARERMVAEQVAARGINDPLVLDAMRVVPGEEFEWLLSCPWADLTGGGPTPPPVPEDPPEPQKGRLKRWQP